jgi:hypothetical protein
MTETVTTISIQYSMIGRDKGTNKTKGGTHSNQSVLALALVFLQPEPHNLRSHITRLATAMRAKHA